MDKFDILIRGGALRGQAGQLFDIGVAGGKIAAIQPKIDGAGEIEIEAGGSLVSASSSVFRRDVGVPASRSCSPGARFR